MKKHKAKRNTSAYGNLQSPYYKSQDYSMTDFYNAYKEDAEKVNVIGTKRFSKIISKCEFYKYNEPTLVIIFEPQKVIQIGDILVDEHDREFTIKVFPMIRFIDEIPEWYLNAPPIVIQGKSYEIGEYIRKKENCYV